MVEPTYLKNISQNGNLPEIGVNIKIFETTTLTFFAGLFLLVEAFVFLLLQSFLFLEVMKHEILCFFPRGICLGN